MTRSASFIGLALFLIACSSQPSREHRDAGARARVRADAGASAAPAVDGGHAAGPAKRYAGTIRGATEVPDGGLPDGAAPWNGEGTLQLDVRGEEVEGRVEASGMTLDAHGNLGGGSLRAWLRAPSGRPRTEGVLVGDRDGADKLRGTWRVSGPAGAEVRAGTFEATAR